MTLSTTINTISYTGNAVTTEFSFPYLFYADADLKVYVDEVLVTTGYTVAGAGVDAGGAVTFSVAPVTDAAIIIEREVTNIQATDFENFDGNPADVTEKQFDLVVMQTQQLATKVARSAKIPNELGGSYTVTLPTPVDGELLSWDGVSGNIVNASLADISTSLDTVFASLTTGDIVQYNGTNWVNIASSSLLSTEFIDNVFRVQDDGDNTKEVAFQLSGITTGTTRSVTFPDIDGTLLYVGQVLDEDDFSTNSAVYPPSQQSTKAYIDAKLKRTVLRQSAGQSLANGWNVLSWNTETIDDGNWHDNSTNPSRVTVDATGYYDVSGAYATADINNGEVGIAIAVNGTRLYTTRFNSGGSVTGGKGLSISQNDIPLTSGDYVEIHALHSSAPDNTIIAETRFAVRKVL